MEKFIGGWKLDKPILCKREVSGKCFQSNSLKTRVTFCFSTCLEFYDRKIGSFDKGDLITH